MAFWPYNQEVFDVDTEIDLIRRSNDKLSRKVQTGKRKEKLGIKRKKKIY